MYFLSLLMVEIIEAGPEYAELIADLSRDTFYETFASENSEADMEKFMKEQFTKGKLMMEVGNPAYKFFLAKYNGKVAGYLKLRFDNKPLNLASKNPLEIARIYVKKDFIGKKIGGALMNKALEIANSGGNDTLWLGVWERNETALAFYRKYGFEKFGDTDFLLGNDLQRDWLMMKRLVGSETDSAS